MNQDIFEATIASNGDFFQDVKLHRMGAGDETRQNVPIYEDPGTQREGRWDENY